jgi:Flp pilus assembly protein TadB
MSLKSRWRALERNPLGRMTLLVVGALFLIAAPIVGLLPGPGGIPLAVIGATLMLRYAKWTKRVYVRLKRRWPKQGRVADWGLRRASAKRRAGIRAQAD